jgi:hypothetical protein
MPVMSPRRIEDKTTASHRPAFCIPMFLLLGEISATAQPNSNLEPGELVPSEKTIDAAMHLIAEVPFRLLEGADVSPFFGEVHLSWSLGQKQIVLMVFPNRTPLIHHYLRIPGDKSEHNIETASSERITYWLRWLRA